MTSLMVLVPVPYLGQAIFPTNQETKEKHTLTVSSSIHYTLWSVSIHFIPLTCTAVLHESVNSPQDIRCILNLPCEVTEC